MSTTTVTLIGNVSDALGVDFTPAQTWVTVTYNTDIVSTDDGYRLGAARVHPDDGGDFELADVVAATDAVDNLLVTVVIDYVDRAARRHTDAALGTYDLSAETGTVDLRTLDETQYAPGERTSEILDEMQALRDEVAEISGLTGEDGAVAALVADTGSDTAAALAATIDAAVLPVLEGPLGRSRGKLSVTPATTKIVIGPGDSTSAPDTQASVTPRRILGFHGQQGEALSGLGSADRYTDGVANGTTTFTSATATFTSADQYRLIHGKGILPATMISSVTNSTTVVLNQSVPSGTALPFWVGRHVIAGGNNGMPLSYWLANPNFTRPTYGVYSQTTLLADNPDLCVASWLINDIRQGALGTTVAACTTAGIALLQQYVDWHRANLPDCDLLLRMPNSLLSENVGGVNAVTDGSTTNPAGQAQIYSTALNQIYKYFVGKYDNVDVVDAQGKAFGTRSRSKLATDPRMVDQLHPSTYTASDLSGIVPIGGGYVAIADALAERIGFTPNAFPDEGATRVQHKLLIYSAPSTGVARCINLDPNVPASQLAVSLSDPAFVNGIEGAQTITNIDPFVASNFLQLTFSGSTDFTPYIGQVVTILATHSPSGVGEKQWVSVNLPAVSAGSWNLLDVTVTGVRPGNTGKAVGVDFEPGLGFANQYDLRILGHPEVVADDTVRIFVQEMNAPGGPAIDLTAEAWCFWTVR